MKINSDSLKEDVLKLLHEVMTSMNVVVADEEAKVITWSFIVTAAEFGTEVIDHDTIGTQEDLEACAHLVADRVLNAVCMLIGKAPIGCRKEGV